MKLENKLTAIVLIIFISFILIGFSKEADAATLTKRSDTTVELSGKIEEGDAKNLASYLERNTLTTTIKLDSEGGNAIEGYRLGYAIRNADMVTIVGYEAKCLSACGTAFLGGTSHIISGALAFHVSWVPTELETNDALKQGQYLGMVESGYMFDMGYTNQLGVLVSQVTSADTFLLIESVADLEMFRMVDGQFNNYIKLPRGWISGRVAGPMRLHLIVRGY